MPVVLELETGGLYTSFRVLIGDHLYLATRQQINHKVRNKGETYLLTHTLIAYSTVPITSTFQPIFLR